MVTLVDYYDQSVNTSGQSAVVGTSGVKTVTYLHFPLTNTLIDCFWGDTLHTRCHIDVSYPRHRDRVDKRQILILRSGLETLVEGGDTLLMNGQWLVDLVDHVSPPFVHHLV